MDAPIKSGHEQGPDVRVETLTELTSLRYGSAMIDTHADSYRLSVRPVPEPLWGVNLRTILGKYRWSKLRSSLIQERGLTCETCGKALEKSRQIQAHEEWSYATSTTPAVAKIERIVLDCWHCHACEHFLRTRNMHAFGDIEDNVVEEVISHFCRVNGISGEDFDRHLEASSAEWRRLSELDWAVDYGQFAELVDRFGKLPSRPLERTATKDDPLDSERVDEFLSDLGALCGRYGYWIGRSSKRSKLPLHVRSPGDTAGEYEVEFRTIIPLVSPEHCAAGIKTEIHISWSDDPILQSPVSNSRDTPT